MLAELDRSIPRTALLVALAMAAIVGTALAFEHIGGYLPCKLCLEQRTPYYLGVPVMLLAAFAAILVLLGFGALPRQHAAGHEGVAGNRRFADGLRTGFGGLPRRR